MLKNLDDKSFLWVLRAVLFGFAIAATLMAVNSTSTMYEMVQNAYKVTLVAAFVPLAMGVYWKRSTTQGAILSIALGVTTWLAFEFTLPEGAENKWAIVPPQLFGLLAAFIGMIVGSIGPQIIRQRMVDDSEITERRSSPSLGH